MPPLHDPYGSTQGTGVLLAGLEPVTAPVTPAEVVAEFWRLMATNDFASTVAVLADDFVLDWPQSNERIVGAADFARMNSEYPAHGQWTFIVDRLVADRQTVVTDVRVSDGVEHARAISFFTVTGGLIRSIVEYWPTPANRSHLVRPIT